jgi:glutathione S-transferase
MCLQVPSGLLPVLEIDGRVVTESATIMALLEEQFPDHKPLMPAADSPQRPRADQLMRLERRFFSDWLNWLCRCAAFLNGCCWLPGRSCCWLGGWGGRILLAAHA